MMLVNYFMAKRYIIASTLFCALTSLNFIVSITEMQWLVNKRFTDIDGEIAIAAVLASIAMMSYN
jgi:hypothetical protein